MQSMSPYKVGNGRQTQPNHEGFGFGESFVICNLRIPRKGSTHFRVHAHVYKQLTTVDTFMAFMDSESLDRDNGNGGDSNIK